MKLLSLLVSLLLLACASLQLYLMEENNNGLFSGLFTVILTLPIAASWLLTITGAALMISIGNKRGARIAAFILLGLSAAAMIVLLCVAAGGDEWFLPLPPLLLSVFFFFLPAIMKKMRANSSRMNSHGT